MKSLITLSFMLTAFSTSLALAKSPSASTYKCAVLDAEDDYSVELNLNSEKAAFFDNDNWSIVPQVSVKYIETEPAQFEYTFSGKDKYNSRLTIVFNLGKSDLSRVSYATESSVKNKKLNCRKVKPNELYSGI